MTERKPFLLRLPPDLHDELRAWADQELRSLNGQIEYLLRDAVRRRGSPSAKRGSTVVERAARNDGPGLDRRERRTSP